MKKYRILKAIVAAAMIAALAGCSNTDNFSYQVWKIGIEAEGLENGRLTMETGDEVQVRITEFLPLHSTEHDVVWYTLDDKVAVVTSNGLIKAVGPGSTIVGVQGTLEPYATTEIKVTVTGGAPVPDDEQVTIDDDDEVSQGEAQSPRR